MAPFEMNSLPPVPPRLRLGTSRAPAGELVEVLGVRSASSRRGPPGPRRRAADAPRRGDAPALARGGPVGERRTLVGWPSSESAGGPAPTRETSLGEGCRPGSSVREVSPAGAQSGLFTPGEPRSAAALGHPARGIWHRVFPGSSFQGGSGSASLIGVPLAPLRIGEGRGRPESSLSGALSRRTRSVVPF